MLAREVIKLVNAEEINKKYSYWEEGEYELIGIRVQEQEFELGTIDHISKVWDDNEETEEELSGICAIDIADITRLRCGYLGEHVAVICGNRGHGGEDFGEIIIEDPVVVEILA